MLGGVVGHMLLDMDLWNMLDCVVNLVSNLVDNWGVGNSDWGSNGIGGNWGGLVDNLGGSWDSVGGNSGGLNLNRLDLNLWGSDDRGSILNNWGGLNHWCRVLDNWSNLANGINKSILVQVLRETHKGQGSKAIRCGHKVSHSLVNRSRGGSLVDVWLGCSNNNLWVSSRGSQS